MLIIKVAVNGPTEQAMGMKEQIAMDLERFGDTRVLSVEEVKETAPEQLTLEETKTVTQRRREDEPLQRVRRFH